MITFERFEPGDCTSYLLGWTMVPPGAGRDLGFGDSDGYLVVCANFGHAVALIRGQRVDADDLRQVWRDANPWTIRAVLLWLSKQPVDLQVVVDPERSAS